MEWPHARKGALSLSLSDLILVSRGPLIRIAEPPDALVATDHVRAHVTRIFVRGTGSCTHVAGHCLVLMYRRVLPKAARLHINEHGQSKGELFYQVTRQRRGN